MRPFLTLLLFVFLAKGSRAQEAWGGGVDDETIHFGFTLQNINTDLIVQKAGIQAQDPQLRSISSAYRPGFGLGGLANLKLGNQFDLRFTPTLLFPAREIYFEYSNSPLVTRKLEGTSLDLPLSLKLKSNRRKNFRAYVIGGPKYTLNLMSEKKLDDSKLDDAEKLLKLKKGFLSYEAGIGFDLYFENFKISPEVRFSQSVGDVLRADQNRYRSAIDKAFLRSVQFSLFLE